jgi:hypothetical protein
MGFLKRMLGGGDKPPPGPDWAGPMSAEEAAAFVEAVGSEIERRGLTFELGDGRVRIHRGGASSDYGLTNLAQVCVMAGRDAWQGTIASHFDNLMAAEDAQTKIDEMGRDLDAVRSMLKIRLYPAPNLGGIDANPPVSWELAPGLVAAFVYDLPTTVMSVNAEHITSWGRDRDELLAIAMDNVRTDSVETQPIGDGGASAPMACVADHFFAASHAFLLGERLPPEARDGAVFAVPHRHVLFYAPIVDLGVVQSINTLIPMAVSLFQQGPGSISPGLYWWRKDGITLLPAQADGRSVQFAPPDEFVQVLNGLGPPGR